MIELDMKLLTILEDLSKTGNVSQTAENLQLSQPTVSVALRKLRQIFGDPLFVRTSSGMQPTNVCTELLPGLNEALELLRRATNLKSAFDPKKSEHRFRICATSISQVVVVPNLISHLTREAPSVILEISDITVDTPVALENGKADLAIGFLPQLESGFYQQNLFAQRFVCMVRKDHPRIRDKITLEDFLAESHILIAASWTGQRVIDKALAERNIKRRIALSVPNILCVAAIVSNTDFLVTVPERYGELLSESAAIQAMSLPVDIPAYSVKQYWHERYHNDPASRWLRSEITGLLGKRMDRYQPDSKS